MSGRGSTTSESDILNIHIEISSWLCALLTFKFLIILIISSLKRNRV